MEEGTGGGVGVGQMALLWAGGDAESPGRGSSSAAPAAPITHSESQPFHRRMLPTVAGDFYNTEQEKYLSEAYALDANHQERKHCSQTQKRINTAVVMPNTQTYWTLVKTN